MRRIVPPFLLDLIVTLDWLLVLSSFGAALGVSFFSSMTGVSGAFALVPYQISVLGISGPVVSSTNHLYNLIATPGGIARWLREGRLDWGLLLVLSAGSVPGALLGAWIRVHYLVDPNHFRFFAGLILLGMGLRLLRGAGSPIEPESPGEPDGPSGAAPFHSPAAGGLAVRAGFTRLLVPLSLLVGIVGGTYGIGGAVIIAPFLVGVLGLAFEDIAGSLLASTFLTSFASIAAYLALGMLEPGSGAAPNWSLGLSFGLGGLAGTYGGSRFRSRFSPSALRLILAASVLAVALRYLWPA